MVSRPPFSPLLLLVVVVLVIGLLPSSSLAQDFRPIDSFRTEVSRQIQGIQLPPFCPPTNEEDDSDNVDIRKVPPHLVVTIIPASDESLVDVRTVPPHLVTAVVKENSTLGFYWDFDAIAEAMESARLMRSQQEQEVEDDDEGLECGMIIQIPNSALQRLEAWGNGITIQLLVGATQLSHIHIHEGAVLHAVLDDSRPSVTMSGLGTEATITSEQGVRQVQVTNDATLKLSGDILNSLTVDRAYVHLEGHIVSGKEESNILDISVDTTSETEMEPNDDVLQVPQQSTVSSKGVLTVSDPSGCEGVILVLAGECVVDPDLHIFPDVGGSLTSRRSGRSDVNDTTLMLDGDIASLWLTCPRHFDSNALSSSATRSTTLVAVAVAAAAFTTTVSMILSLVIVGIE